MVHLISASRPSLVIVNKKKRKRKKTCRIVDFAITAKTKKEVNIIISEKRSKSNIDDNEEYKTRHD